MKNSSSSAASTLTYESDLSSRRSHYLNTFNYGRQNREEARLFDLVLKKLETVRNGAQNNCALDVARCSDDRGSRSSSVRRNERSRFHAEQCRDDSVVCGRQPARYNYSESYDEDDNSYSGRFALQGDDYDERDEDGFPSQFGDNRKMSDEHSFSEEKLPDAILKLDRRHAIPRPRHKNDVLVEIEVRIF
jgi:hypothetical protein